MCCTTAVLNGVHMPDAAVCIKLGLSPPSWYTAATCGTSRRSRNAAQCPCVCVCTCVCARVFVMERVVCIVCMLAPAEKRRNLFVRDCHENCLEMYCSIHAHTRRTIMTNHVTCTHYNFPRIIFTLPSSKPTSNKYTSSPMF